MVPNRFGTTALSLGHMRHAGAGLNPVRTCIIVDDDVPYDRSIDRTNVLEYGTVSAHDERLESCTLIRGTS